MSKSAAERAQYYFRGMTMKGIKKYLFMLMALAAVFGFVACSDDDDDDDGPSKVAVYKADMSDEEGEDIYTLTFYSDKSFRVVENLKDYSDGQTWSDTVATGTYTGDPTQEGKITATIKQVFDTKNWKLVSKEMEAQEITIANDKFNFTIYWSDAEEFDTEEFEFTRSK